MLHKYHVIYGVWYYPQFYISAVGLGAYYPWMQGITVPKNFYELFILYFNIYI
jgi:hypothetical protein